MNFFKWNKVLKPFLFLYIGAILLPTFLCTGIYFSTKKDFSEFLDREIQYTNNTVKYFITESNHISSVFSNYLDFKNLDTAAGYIKNIKSENVSNIFILSPTLSTLYNDLSDEEDKLLFENLNDNFLNYKEGNLYPYKNNKAIYYKKIKNNQNIPLSLAFIINFDNLDLNQNLVQIKNENGLLYNNTKNEDIDYKNGYLSRDINSLTIVFNHKNAKALFVFGILLTLLFSLFSINIY